ncbi:26S proteasome non-ATPase regulatory subunit 12-like [Metopolophium dirhodum]|uniref:26S proteasome non-ATPase regulatory subunit 12-like n=1 Tax=Metopolophium dirhodum TaxID=44670 RepID=UPI00298F4F75|nr:26S proteasome non-ATPase regulatory subunit 12-like [Metopolophium dirhodum]
MMDNLEPLNTDGGRTVKMDVHYSAMCDETIAVAESLAASGKLPEALYMLLMLEKQTRNGSDIASTGRLLVAIVKLCFQAKEWALLNEHIFLLKNRKSQLELAVRAMVGECCIFIDQMPDEKTKLKLIQSLRIVTEGQISMVLDRVQLTQKLAQIKEDKGDVTGAESITQELQVEAYDSMKTQEELIYEQFRLCLAMQFESITS